MTLFLHDKKPKKGMLQAAKEEGFEQAMQQVEALEAEVLRLRSALETCEAWIDRWSQHVGHCKGEDKCTCGRSRILHESRAALNPRA